ncbi:hypothetical protein FORMB_02750 [Formosa sp. Hel1_33_131]|uniref:T9SS type A sorting domain-containing protein n=1 Tax=Formosa sp. Hel1_33_131 TaxID=1336794 RepID=UPI00084E1DAB|nr:T9SS type A sorting domain-containing protein [Formosa sp. Hel1_33_131]AOR27336.1 hypothetical protein FORMB_02750 [Formosa sp. Hel1_33_131]
MHKLLIALLLATSFCFSQTLSIESGSFVSVNSNSSVSVDGLELSPSVSHTITGPNSIARSTTPIVVGDNSSIERVYELSNELTDYSGILSFRYLDSELNGIDEAELVLEVLDANDVWNNVAPNIDDTNNILSYDFTELVGFKKITASASSATLTIKTETLNDIVRVYPNPTTDKIIIVSNFAQHSTLFNTAGQKILESNALELDVTDLPTGVYLLNLQNTQNQISTFKIIKQ